MENNEEKTVNENTGVANANDDKLITILSYFGILWIVSYILYGNKKSEYNAFHLRQGLGLIILYFVVMIFSIHTRIHSDPWLVGYIRIVYPTVCFLDNGSNWCCSRNSKTTTPSRKINTRYFKRYKIVFP
jgi:uncharacterized membrane protein